MTAKVSGAYGARPHPRYRAPLSRAAGEGLCRPSTRSWIGAVSVGSASLSSRGDGPRFPKATRDTAPASHQRSVRGEPLARFAGEGRAAARVRAGTLPAVAGRDGEGQPTAQRP